MTRRAGVFGSGPVGPLLLALVLWAGCATPRPSLARAPLPEATGGSGGEADILPALFPDCASPTAFVQAQRGVDMVQRLEALDDWSAVRLGALGPVPPRAAEVLNRKRASFLVAVTREHGVALAEVFALFVLHTSSDLDLEQVLHHLAQDKRLGQTLGRMSVAREQLRQRGLRLANFPDRAERPWRDALRGAREGTGDLLSSTPLLQVDGLVYTTRKAQLPAPYRHALDELETALAKQALTTDHVALGVLDELTFGMPLGLYYLGAGLGQGLSSLTQGEYEQAARELTPAALLVALYAYGKGTQAWAGARGAPRGGTPGLPLLKSRVEELKEVARGLRERLGSDGLEAVARSLRADPEAALLVIEGGEAGAVALYEMRGQVPKARARVTETKSAPPERTRTQVGAAALADEAVDVPREVVDARLLEAEPHVPGARLSGDVAKLEKQLVELEQVPPVGATDHPLWNDYLRYGRERLGDLRSGKKVHKGRELAPPLKWDGYQHMRGLVTRGLAFERHMAKLLRADAALPRAQRRFLRDFHDPRIETYVGVRKPQSGLRFADVLVIERAPPAHQPPRVETFSFKSRDLSKMGEKALTAQMETDAHAAWAYYGQTLDILRPGLKLRVDIQRVRLIYEGGALRPGDSEIVKEAVSAIKNSVPGVEVEIQ